MADVPETASLRNVKQFNSYYGCDWCLIKTERFNKKNIYSLNETKFTLRTKTDMRMIAISIQKEETSESFGIKGFSPFYDLRFDFVSGFTVESLHCVYLGVNKLV